MANRYRPSRETRQQQGFEEDRYGHRQSEQFQPQGDYQYGEQADGYNDYDDRARRDYDDRDRQNQARDRSSWRERENRRGREDEPLGDYDHASHPAGQRAAQRRYTEHTTFRGDDFGAGQVAGPRPRGGGYAGATAAPNFFSPGGGDYGHNRSDRDRHERGFFDRAGDEISSWFGDDDAERRREMDHRGRGPSNYKRSDERILEDACDRLTDDRGVDASDITVSVDGGEVTLDGTVDTLSQKRRAEDCVHHVSGAGHVQNNLRLSETEMRAGSDSTPGTLA